jgi:cyclopropane-fatty-acyl-phospholipid synthase
MATAISGATSLVPSIDTKNPTFRRANRTTKALFKATSMAIAEAYINGIEIPDRSLEFLVATSARVCYRYFPSLMVPYEWLLQESELLAEGSQELMEVQYDLPEELFRIMLGEGKLLYPKYSMALWEKGATNLKRAQIDMLDDLIEKAGIQDGDEILDLGCGWGSAANYILARFPNVKVTGLNLSHEQCDYIRGKIRDSESHLSSNRFTLYEGDFNEIQFDNKFDKIITIGMFEHIGNLTGTFRKLANFLKEDGKVLIHIITTNLPYNITHLFINKYIFPNMRVWNFNVIPDIDKSLKTIDRWYLNGANYSKTLKSWLNSFDNNQAEIRELNYQMNYNRFRRIWRFYLFLCIHHFDACGGTILGNGQYLLVRA